MSTTRQFLTSEEAAELLRSSSKTLERWRSEGCGPPYIKIFGLGILYRLADIDAFLEENTVRTNNKGDER